MPVQGQQAVCMCAEVELIVCSSMRECSAAYVFVQTHVQQLPAALKVIFFLFPITVESK